MVVKAQGFLPSCILCVKVKNLLWAEALLILTWAPSWSSDVHKSLGSLGTHTPDLLLAAARAIGPCCCQSEQVSQSGDGEGRAYYIAAYEVLEEVFQAKYIFASTKYTSWPSQTSCVLAPFLCIELKPLAMSPAFPVLFCGQQNNFPLCNRVEESRRRLWFK